MGKLTAIVIIIASLYMWGKMLYDIISLHYRLSKRRKVRYDEYAK